MEIRKLFLYQGGIGTRGAKVFLATWLLSNAKATVKIPAGSRNWSLRLLLLISSLLCVYCLLLQVLRYLLPAAGLQTQDDTNQSGGDAQWLLAHSHFHLLSTHHAKLEHHWHRGHCESSLAKLRNRQIRPACFNMKSSVIWYSLFLITFPIPWTMTK